MKNRLHKKKLNLFLESEIHHSAGISLRSDISLWWDVSPEHSDAIAKKNCEANQFTDFNMTAISTLRELKMNFKK